MKEKLQKLDYLNIVMTLVAILYAILKIEGIKNTIISVIIIIFASLFTNYVLKMMRRKNIKLEYIYLIFAIVIGIGYLIALPVVKIPDSRNDYLRSLEISNLNITTTKKGTKVGRYYSTNIDKVYRLENKSGVKYKDINLIKDRELNDEKKFYTYATKSLYAFVCYIPQAIGVGIGKLLNMSIYNQTILGKIFNYALFVLLVFTAIKYIPVKKELVFFLAMLPMTVQEALSLSPDSMTIATSIFFVSMLIYFKTSKEMFNMKWKIILFIISILLSMCKIVYLPLCFLILLIPKDKYNSKKEKYIYCSILLLTVVVLNLTWLRYSSRYLVAFLGRSNSSLQLKFILGNPIKYCFIIFNTIDLYSIVWLEQLLGLSIGIYSIPTFSVYIISSAFLLILYTIRNDKSKKQFLFNNIEKGYTLLIALGTFILICTSLYMQWTEPYLNYIDGIQGRYFIPLVLLISMVFMTKEKDIKYKNTITYSVLINVAALVAVVASFL